MQPVFRKPAPGWRRIEEHQARLTFGRHTGFEAEGDRQHPFLAMEEEFASRYQAGRLEDQGCDTLRAVATHLADPLFQHKLNELLKPEEDKGVRKILRSIMRQFYSAYDWLKGHPRGHAEVHWNEGSVRLITPVETPPTEEDYRKRKAEQWERHQQAKKTHMLEETTQVDLQVVHAPRLPTQGIKLPAKPPSRAS